LRQDSNSALPANQRVPHIPDFLWSLVGSTKLYAPFLNERRTRGRVQGCVQEIRGISLVFREMWDTTALTPYPLPLQIPFKPLHGPR
jgi:hypothetical protein